MMLPPISPSFDPTVMTKYISDSDSDEEIDIQIVQKAEILDDQFFILESDYFLSESDIELNISSYNSPQNQTTEENLEQFIDSSSSDFDFEAILSNSNHEPEQGPIIIKNPPIATAALKSFIPESSDSGGPGPEGGSEESYENTYETTNSTTNSTTSYTNSTLTTTTTTSTYTTSASTYRIAKSIAASDNHNFFFESDSN